MSKRKYTKLINLICVIKIVLKICYHKYKCKIRNKTIQ